MTIARELVTLLRYEIDESNLNKFNRMRPGGGRAPNNVPGLPTPAVIDSTSTGLGRLGLMLRGLVAGISVISAARVADEWAGVEGRVGLVTDGIVEQKEALDGLYTAAQRSRQSYTGLASVFQGIARNKTELGLTTEQALKLSETVGTAMTIGGGSASSQQAALMQLSQALGTGTLRGEELNSIMEQAPRLAQAIAKAFDAPVGKLKELGEKGKLSSKILAEGLLKQSSTLREEFERMPMTFAGAWVTLSNAMGRQIDKLNRASGAARVFYRVTSLVVDNLETIIKYVALIGSAVIFTKIAYATRALAAAGGIFGRMLARFGGAKAFGVLIGTFARMLALATLLYYVFDDIGVWFRGGDSLLGDIIGPMTDWKWLADGVKVAFQNVLDVGKAIGNLFPAWARQIGVIGGLIGLVIVAIGWLPALIAAGVLVIAFAINTIRQNWGQAVGEMKAIWKSLVDGVLGTWDTILAKAKDVWSQIGAAIAGISGVWTSLTNLINGAWDTILAKAKDVWSQIGAAIANAVPEWARNGFNFVSDVVNRVRSTPEAARTPAQLGVASFGKTPTGPATATGLGSGVPAPFGVTPAMMPPRAGGITNTTTTQAPQVTVYATTPQPAAVAEAARRGTERGMSSAMVPNVEASR